jgi:hypothetical protein
MNAWFRPVVSEGAGKPFSCRIMRIGCVTPDRWSWRCFMRNTWQNWPPSMGTNGRLSPPLCPMAMRRCYICLICDEQKESAQVLVNNGGIKRLMSMTRTFHFISLAKCLDNHRMRKRAYASHVCLPCRVCFSCSSSPPASFCCRPHSQAHPSKPAPLPPTSPPSNFPPSATAASSKPWPIAWTTPSTPAPSS